jgi:hypothetical protein
MKAGLSATGVKLLGETHATPPKRRGLITQFLTNNKR